MNDDRELFFVLSTIEPARRADMGGLRAEHLQFVLAMRDRVQHGGVLAGPEGPEAISMVLAAASREEAVELVAADPYRALYSSVEVSRFVQRVPEAHEGELREMLEEALGTDPEHR
jgi:uncharacterized protein YciI